MKKLLSMILVASAMITAKDSPGAMQYWDTSPEASYQHGDGTWSTAPEDAYWAISSGTVLGPWTNGNDATFASFGGSSIVTLNTSLTTGVAYVTGSGYTLNITNGGRIVSTSTVAIGNANGANDNRVTVAGGAGVVSSWSTLIMKVGATTAMGTTNNLVVVDGKGVPGSAVMSNTTLAVGASGGNAGNELRVVAGGRLFTTISTTIGSLSTGNTVRVLGSGSQWDVGGGIVYVGLNDGSAFNSLILDDGALVFNAGTLSVGNSGSASNEVRVIGGSSLYTAGASTTLGNYSTGNLVRVSGAGSQWICNGGTMNIVGYSNVLSVEDSAMASNAGAMNIGGAGSYSNEVRMSGGGRLSVAGALNIGYGSSIGNVLRVRGSGSQLTAAAINLGTGVAGPFNSFVVEDSGLAVLSGALAVGSSSSPSNEMQVTGGGRLVIGANSTIGNLTPGNTLRVQGSGAQFDGNGKNLTVGSGATAVSNLFIVDGLGVAGGALATNVAIVTVGTGSGSGWNSMVITNGGKLSTYSACVMGTASSNNSIRVTGAGSLWDLGNVGLTIGNATSINNGLIISQSGAVDSLGTLTVWTNNSVSLLGGTLGVANTTYTNSLFSAGDGSQAATLKVLANGTLTFTRGLLVNSNSTLIGNGTVSGGAVGVTLTNGAFLSPGISGIGSLGVNGSGMTWCRGGTFRCDVTNLNWGAGVGWDQVTVPTQLTFAAGTGYFTIKLNSGGGDVDNFDPSKNYSLRILSYGSQTGFDPAAMSLDKTDFSPSTGWTLTNAANALWLVYRGSAAPDAADYTWNAPANGNWDSGANWAGASAPPAGGGTSLKLAFGDTGVRYRSTNNLAGAFQVNQMRFSSGSSVTNLILGNQIALTNTGARVDYLAGETGGFIVSNTVRLTTDTEFGGDSFGSTLTLAGVVTNLGTLTKRGPWTLALGAVNDMIGPVVVDGADSILRAESTRALNGSGPVIVSNGQVVITTTTYVFSSAKNNRQAMVKGSGASWTNNAAFTVSEGAANVQLVVDGGFFHAPTLLMFLAGSRDGMILVTNGGQLICRSNNSIVGNDSTNCLFQLTGANSYLYRNQTFGAGFGAGTGNRIIIEKGARVTGSTSFGLFAGGPSNSVLVSEGAYVSSGGANAPAIGALNVLGSNSTTLVTGNGTFVAGQGGSGVSAMGIGADYGNTMTIASNAVVSNINVQVAAGWSSQNRLIVTNGGKLFSYASINQFVANGTGALANVQGNEATVTGPGSMWDMKNNPLTVCQSTGSLNKLLIQDGGLVTNVTTLLVANGAGAQGNSVTVNGGMLQAALLTWSNTLPNSFTLTGNGLAILGNLVATNANQLFAFNGGSLVLKNSLVATGGVFVAGDGSQAALLTFVPGGTNIFVHALAITNNATLAGSGLIQATTTVYGVLSPGGAGLGSVTNNGLFALTNGATARFELAANTAPGSGWDLLTVTNGALSLGGTLAPVLKGGFQPGQADRFLILTNQGPLAVGGNFSNGERATIYADDLTTRVGTFKIEKGPQGVVLTDFQLLRSNGSLIIVR